MRGGEGSRAMSNFGASAIWGVSEEQRLQIGAGDGRRTVFGEMHDVFLGYFRLAIRYASPEPGRHQGAYGNVRFITRVYRRLWNGCPGRGRSIAGRGSGSMDAMLRLGSKGRDVKDHFGGTEAGSLAGGQQGEGVDVGRECGCFSGVGMGMREGALTGRCWGRGKTLCFLTQEVLGGGETGCIYPMA